MNTLDLRNLGIRKIETGAFTQYNSTLEELYLTQNLLEDIPWSAIKELLFLKKLLLDKNKISTLEKKHFLGMDDLSYLKLSGNRITHIDTDGLCSSAMNLGHLKLDNNPLTSRISLGKCHYIGHLSLMGCSFKTLPTFIGTNNTVITIATMEFAENMLRFLESTSFSNLNITHYLSLSVNKLTVTGVSSMVWKPLGNLNALSLESNAIEKVPSGYFRYLHNMRLLYLAKNKIFVLEPGSFTNLSQLIFLDIANNNLSELPPGVFKDLIALRTLKMGGNQLSHIPIESFWGLRSLKVLQLEENNIHSIIFLLPGPNVLLNLMRNPIACSCSLLEIMNASFSSSSACIHQNCSTSRINRLSIDICDTIPMNRTAVGQCIETSIPATTTIDCSLSGTCELKSQSSNSQPEPGMLIKLLIISFASLQVRYHYT